MRIEGFEFRVRVLGVGEIRAIQFDSIPKRESHDYDCTVHGRTQRLLTRNGNVVVFLFMVSKCIRPTVNACVLP